jgi:hypothetical protein
MSFWIGSNGYHGGEALPGDQEVPERPSPFHTWDGEQWVLVDGGLNASIKAQIFAIESANLVTQRALRESIVGYCTAFKALAATSKLIITGLGPAVPAPTAAAINAQLDQITAKADDQIAKVLPVENQIIPLRAQLLPE